MPATNWLNLRDFAAAVPRPVLIVSTVVGRGMYSLGEALREHFPDSDQIHHVAVEDFLPPCSVTEDLRRYKWISNRLPALLYLVYKVPVFYYRKYLRERWFTGADLSALHARIKTLAPRTVVCVSHRPAFWVSSLKWREGLDFRLWGLLGEYGYTLGWKYIFWDQMNGFLSPVPRDVLAYDFPASLNFREIDLPARQAFARLADHPGDRNCALLVCGYWGQGPILRVVCTLRQEAPAMQVLAVCGENTAACEEARRVFAGDPRVTVYGAVDSLVPILRQARCVVTKPGISTLVEAHAAGRRIFLLKGMPVAEDNNARYAVRHFGAEWFGGDSFRRWYQAEGN